MSCDKKVCVSLNEDISVPVPTRLCEHNKCCDCVSHYYASQAGSTCPALPKTQGHCHQDALKRGDIVTRMH